MDLHNSCAGRYCKPPCGAVAKSYGIEQSRKRWSNPSGINNGDEHRYCPPCRGFVIRTGKNFP